MNSQAVPTLEGLLLQVNDALGTYVLAQKLETTADAAETKPFDVLD